MILDCYARAFLVFRHTQIEPMWFTLIVAKLITTYCIHWFYLNPTLCSGVFHYSVKQTHSHWHRDHSWGRGCEVWPFYPLSSPWGSVWVQYSGGLPLWLLMSPIQYETRLEGHLPFSHTHTHTHTHTQIQCLSLTSPILLSWLLMWCGPSKAFSHHSCSLSLPYHSHTLPTHTSTARHPH